MYFLSSSCYFDTELPEDLSMKCNAFLGEIILTSHDIHDKIIGGCGSKFIGRCGVPLIFFPGRLEPVKLTIAICGREGLFSGYVSKECN